MGTTTTGLPYPENTDPVRAGAEDIKRLAEAIDPRAYPALAAAGERRSTTTTQNVANETIVRMQVGTTWNVSGGMSAPGSGLRLPTPGWYLLTAGVRFDSNSNGYRQLRIMLDEETTIVNEQENAGGFTTVTAVAMLLIPEGGVVATAHLWQNSGGTLATTATFGYPYLSAALLGKHSMTAGASTAGVTPLPLLPISEPPDEEIEEPPDEGIPTPAADVADAGDTP